MASRFGSLHRRVNVNVCNHVRMAAPHLSGKTPANFVLFILYLTILFYYERHLMQSIHSVHLQI